MVYIHGGGYSYGGAADSEIYGSAMTDLADVVEIRAVQYSLNNVSV